MQTSCRITQEYVRMARFRCRHRIIDNGCRVCALLSADHLHAGAICPLFQLASRRCTESIRRSQNNLFALGLELADAVDVQLLLEALSHADDHDHGLFVFKAIRCLAYVHLLFDALDQQFLAVCRLLDMLLLHLLL